MRLVILSDTHGFHRGMGTNGKTPLAEGDVLIHCGDFSRDFGSWLEVERFADWMRQQTHQYKILCPGNHDYGIYENAAKAASLFRRHGIHMMGQQSFEIEGVVFDGGPWMPISGYTPPWGFELNEVDRERAWARVQKADVLVTHTPPSGILDQTTKGEHLGCPVLRRRTFEVKPRLHCFGHMHEARGSQEEDGIVFLNASSNTRGDFVRDDLNGVTYMTMGIRDAIVFDL